MLDEFTQLAASAADAGWHPEEIASALVEMADHLMLGMIANRELTIQLQAFDKHSLRSHRTSDGS